MKQQTKIAALVFAASLVVLAAPASAAEQVPPPALSWSFAGPFGKYNEGQLQRGFKIYREVCSACHSMNLLSFRNLAEAGGPGFSEAQVTQIASEYKIKDLDDQGNPIKGNERGRVWGAYLYSYEGTALAGYVECRALPGASGVMVITLVTNEASFPKAYADLLPILDSIDLHG